MTIKSKSLASMVLVIFTTAAKLYGIRKKNCLNIFTKVNYFIGVHILVAAAFDPVGKASEANIAVRALHALDIDLAKLEVAQKAAELVWIEHVH